MSREQKEQTPNATIFFTGFKLYFYIASNEKKGHIVMNIFIFFLSAEGIDFFSNCVKRENKTVYGIEGLTCKLKI